MELSDWSQIVTASVVPVVIISACGLLCLAFYNRLASIVSRLRSFQRERLHEQDWLADPPEDADRAVVQRHRQLLAMLEEQTAQVTARAQLVRSALMCLLGTIGCLLLSSLMLGLSVVWPQCIYAGVLFFVLGLLLALIAIVYALREMGSALDPVALESRFIGYLADGADATFGSPGAL